MTEISVKVSGNQKICPSAEFQWYSHKYLVTMPCITRGTKTGTFLLFAWKNCRILSMAADSRRKSNSYPIYSDKKSKIKETNFTIVIWT